MLRSDVDYSPEDSCEFVKLRIILLGMSIAVQRAATHIARKAVEMDIVAGKSPISVAAAAIYMASQVMPWKGVTGDSREIYKCLIVWG